MGRYYFRFHLVSRCATPPCTHKPQRLRLIHLKKKRIHSSTATTSDLEENPPVHGDEAFPVLDVYVPAEQQQGEGGDQGGVPQVDPGVLHLESDTRTARQCYRL